MATPHPTVDLRPPGRELSQDRRPTRELSQDRHPTRELHRDRRPTRKLTFTPTASGSPRLFGEWLVGRGVLTRKELQHALALSQRREWRVGDAVVVLGIVPRVRIEAEAQRFLLHTGREEPRDPQLELRALWLERERAKARER